MPTTSGTHCRKTLLASDLTESSDVFHFLQVDSASISREAVREADTDLPVVAGSEADEEFLAVKWYLDGELLKHVQRPAGCFNAPAPPPPPPPAHPTDTVTRPVDEERCKVDPSKIILVNVRRSFHGNYSCRGRNRAGWGGMSAARELKVLYPPRGAILTQKPSIIKKGRPFQVGRSKRFSLAFERPALFPDVCMWLKD